MRDFSKVNDTNENSCILMMADESMVVKMMDVSFIKEMNDNASVKEMHDGTIARKNNFGEFTFYFPENSKFQML